MDASDPDGSPLDEQYRWQVNGETIEDETEAQLDPQYFTRGDTIAVEVTVSDGADTASHSASTVILNSPPEATVDMESPVKTGSTVTLPGRATDADEDEVSFQWQQISGTEVSLSDPEVAEPTFTAPGEAAELVFALTAADDEAAAEAVEVTVIVNTPPAIDSFSLSPEPAYTDTSLTASLESSDADEDTLTQSYLWRVNGELLEEQTTQSLDSSHYIRGDQVEVTVTVYDGNWETSRSAETTIGNRVPQVSVSADSSVATNQAVTLRGNASDLDGDTLTYQWTQLSGEPVALSSTTEPEPTFTTARVSGELVFSLTASDGEAVSDAAEIAVTVVNTAPRINHFSLSGVPAFTNTDLSATIEAADDDGLPLLTSLQWSVNGEPIEGFEGTTFSSDNYSRGDEVTVTVSVSDGELLASESASTTIQDSPLQVSVVNMPETVQYGEEASFQVLIEDVDGDPFTWRYLARPNGMERDTAGRVSWVPTGPMFDTHVEVNWELAVQQGEETIPVSGAITVLDASRQTPLIKGVVRSSQRKNKFTPGDFEGDGVSGVLISDGEKRIYEFAYRDGEYGITWEYPYAFIKDNAWISSIAAADLDEDGRDEIMVGVKGYQSTVLNNTDLYIFDDERQPSLATTVTGNSIMGIRTADLDNDGSQEIVLLVNMVSRDNSTEKRLTILRASDFSVLWESDILPLGSNLAVGNVDTDPELEIAVDDGYVFGSDGTGYVVEWHYPDGFNGVQGSVVNLEIADVDGDAIGEIIGITEHPTTGYDGFLAAYDAVNQNIKALDTRSSYDFLTFDVDGDGTAEIVSEVDGATILYSANPGDIPEFVLRWGRKIPMVSNIAIANLDDDPELEILADDRSHFSVYPDASDPTLEWESAQPKSLDHDSFYDLALADFNGTGEKLAAMAVSNYYLDYRQQTALLDPQSGRLDWVASVPVYITDRSIPSAISNLNNDGTTQLLYARNVSGGNSTPGIYDFFSESIVWSAAELDSYVAAVTQGELGSSATKLVVLTTASGEVLAYDTSSDQPLWQFASGGGKGLEFTDLDGDGQREILSYSDYAVNLIAAEGTTASMTRSFSPTDDIPQETYEHYFPDLFWSTPRIKRVTTSDLNGDGEQEILIAMSELIQGGDSGIVILNSDFTLQSAMPFPDTRIAAMQVQDYGKAPRNILLNVLVNEDRFDNYFIEVDPFSGKVVSESPRFSGNLTANSMKLVDTNGDGIREVAWSTTDARIYLSR